LKRHGPNTWCAIEVEARLTHCNMATDFSAITGMIAPDEKTFTFLEGRRFAPQGAARTRWGSTGAFRSSPQAARVEKP
jgi:homoaconitase/3-isopropylmalate dehydratase large subunit